MSQATADDFKHQSDDYLDAHAQAIALLNDNVFYFGELGNQEYETAGLMTSLLQAAGFHVTSGISGFPTAFCASAGSGHPIIAIHTEYDSNPDNSQQAGATQERPIVPGAPGHCEGHNCNAAVLVAAAIATWRIMQRHGLQGTLKVIGAPAEEQLLSRPYFVRDGLFDDVDLALTPHIGSEFYVGHGLLQSALISATFRFRGETAHAGVAPWKGRDALDAVVLMDTGMAQYREHMHPSMNCQRVITHGGDQPNVVPRDAAVWWYFRDSTADGVERLFQQAKRIGEGAALMTNTELSVELHSAVWPLRGNEALARLVEQEYNKVGAPHWSEAEHSFAKALQLSAGVTCEGLRNTVRPVKAAGPQHRSANDAGDVSWRIPMAKMIFPANVPNIDFHHWAAGSALATSIAHKGAVAGAKVLARALLHCFTHKDCIDQIKSSFQNETAGTPFKSMLPSGQQPPSQLNAATMAKWREQMKTFYLKDKPRFE